MNTNAANLVSATLSAVDALNETKSSDPTPTEKWLRAPTKFIKLPYSGNVIDLYQVRATGAWKNGYGHVGVRAYLYDGKQIDFNRIQADYLHIELQYLNDQILKLDSNEP